MAPKRFFVLLQFFGGKGSVEFFFRFLFLVPYRNDHFIQRHPELSCVPSKSVHWRKNVNKGYFQGCFDSKLTNFDAVNKQSPARTIELEYNLEIVEVGFVSQLVFFSFPTILSINGFWHVLALMA